eukprot:TRINITY_DN851_c0_g1_i8.p1 TRINITY_DN851_c0_g1~~TRINITY_DN851_c0_g1_i8.p1  ORF type:complete len:502 (-),score=3.76 TRINITY_DN851_c0_g1_i8:217-1611(-)
MAFILAAMTTVFQLVLLMIFVCVVHSQDYCSSSGSQEFGIVYSGQTVFSVGLNGTCSCPQYAGNGTLLTGLDANSYVKALVARAAALENTLANVMQVFQRTCPAGTYLSGYNTSFYPICITADANQCLIPNVCDHGVCQKIPGTFYCVCNTGWLYNAQSICSKPDSLGSNVGSVTLSGVPSRPAYSTATNRVYVPSGGTTISIIDPANNNAVTTKSFAGAAIAVFVSTLGSMFVFSGSGTGCFLNATDDVTTFTYSNSFCPGNLYDGGVYNPVNNKIYLPCRSDGKVGIFDPVTLSLVTSVTVGTTPIGIGCNSATGAVYVANYGSNSVSAIDPNTNAVYPAAAGTTYAHGVAYNPFNQKLYVASLSSSGTFVFTPATSVPWGLTLVTSFGSGAHNVVVHPYKGDVYLNNYGPSTVPVVPYPTYAVSVSISASTNAFGLAYSSYNNRVYVTSATTAAVAIVAPP